MSAIRVSDRYTLDREIGRGGAGAVWLGRDEVLGRTVALKRIGMPPGQSDPDALRAEREARLGARVNHPNVVAVFDLVETSDGHWLVMEHVPGTNLAQAIEQRGPMPLDTAAPLLARVADALAAAHAAGIVHRDVKPSNILLSDDGEVKLSDFGIARAVADASLTQTGLVTGSPAYLSPEVASGGSATSASDVWSLGATMFHALGGRPPYDVGDNVMGAMYRIVHEEPPRLRTAGWLAPLLEMTMTRDPALRPTMTEVRDYLRARPTPTTAGRPTTTASLPAVPPPRPGRDIPPPPDHEPTRVASAARTAGRDRKVGLLAVVGGALAALAVIAAVLLLGRGSGDEDPVAAGDPTNGTEQGPDDTDATSPEPTDETSTEQPTAPTAEDIEAFAATYVATASSNPDDGLAMLTPDFQAQSTAYHDFWGSVRNPQIDSVTGDPDAMTVTYTYTYTFRGEGRRTETVSLRLVQEGDGFLIAGEA